jgi:hypothetical protein
MTAEVAMGAKVDETASVSVPIVGCTDMEVGITTMLVKLVGRPDSVGRPELLVSVSITGEDGALVKTLTPVEIFPCEVGKLSVTVTREGWSSGPVLYAVAIEVVVMTEEAWATESAEESSVAISDELNGTAPYPKSEDVVKMGPTLTTGAVVSGRVPDSETIGGLNVKEAATDVLVALIAVTVNVKDGTVLKGADAPLLTLVERGLGNPVSVGPLVSVKDEGPGPYTLTLLVNGCMVYVTVYEDASIPDCPGTVYVTTTTEEVWLSEGAVTVSEAVEEDAAAVSVTVMTLGNELLDGSEALLSGGTES